MCGILGVRRSWRDDPAAFRRAVDAMAWRGPDGSRVLEVDDWRLAVARLAISDPGNDQPIADPDGRRVALFNGAVTSAAEEWRRHGASARTRNDAELALLRLREAGETGLVRTSGPCAAAVLDLGGDRLWLLRDRAGEKPFYAVRAGGRIVAFASTPASLRALGLACRLTPQSQGRLLRFGFAPPEFEPEPAGAVFAVEGALRGDRDGVTALPVPEQPGAPREFRGRVVDAAGRAAAADVPLGLCLSGGLDSSCLAVAVAEGGRSLPAYQFRASGEPEDERRNAARVAERTGHRLRPVDAGPEILDRLPALTRACGLPLGDPSVLAVHALAQAARADGVKVLLSGEGADDLWLGYRRHRLARWLPRTGVPGLPRPGFATGLAARAWRALTGARPYDELLAVAPPGFLAAVLAEGGSGQAELPASHPRATALARARYVDRHLYLRHDLLPKLDTATMAAGVEGRCPYLDPVLLDAPETHAPDARALLGKRPLRRAFARDLPREVVRAGKRGFLVPLDRWLREDSWLAALLREPRTLERPHLRGAGVRAMLELHLRGRARLGHPLYLLAAWEVYLRTLEEPA